MNPDSWTVIASIAAIIQAVVVIIAVIIALIQLNQGTRARSLDAFLAISQDLRNENIVEARRWIFTKLKNTRNLTNRQKTKVEALCVIFDKIGVLVKHGLIPKDVAFSMYFDVVLRTWNRVESFIKEERERRKNDLWMMYFEALNKECLRYWQDQFKGNWFKKRVRKRRMFKVTPEWKYMKQLEDIFYFHPDEVDQVDSYCPMCGGGLSLQHVDTEKKLRKVCQVCGYIVYENPKPCVGALILKEDQILLTKRNIEPFIGFWDIPGGFLEEGEHPVKGIIREIKEETGLSIEPFKLLDIFMDVYGSEKKSTLNLCYICRVMGGEPKVGSDAKDMHWFNLRSLPDNIAFDWAKEALSLLLKE